MPKDNSPVFKRQVGLMQIAAFENTHEVDGEERTFLNFSIERSYKDKNEEWQKSRLQLSGRDVGMAIALLQAGQLYEISRSSKRED